MHAALLAGTYADGLAVLHVANAVGLGVLQYDEADNEVAALLLADELVLGHDVLQHRGVADVQVLAALLEGHAKDGAGLQRFRLVGGVDLHDGVVALLFAFQHFQRVSIVTGRDDAVGNFVLNELGGGEVADIGQRDPVAKAGHAVGAAGTGVGAGQGRQLGLGGNVVHGAQRVIQRLPGVERIQKVDVARAAVQDLYRQVGAVGHVDAGGLLVGVGAVFQLKFVHINPPQRCICSG